MAQQAPLKLEEVPERAASERLKAVYRDVEWTLQVPFVPWPFRALAVHEAAFLKIWRALKPVITDQLEGAADALRRWLVDTLPRALSTPAVNHRAKLKELRLSKDQIERLQSELHVYHYLDPKLALLVAALREALEGRPVGVRSVAVWPTSRGVPAFMPRVGRVEPAQASGAVARLFDEVQRALELPTVPDEYRTLAQWPEYLGFAWEEIKAMRQREGFRQLVQELRTRLLEGLKDVRRRLELRELEEAERAEVLEKVKLFDRAVTELTVQVGHLALALLGPEEAKLDGLALLRRWALPKP